MHFSEAAEGAGVELQNALDLDDLASKINHLPRVTDRFKAVKTLLNGWTTSRRLHESFCMPCLFGCQQSQDSFGHYVRCTRLRQLVSFLCNENLTKPIHIWSIVEPSALKLKRLACVFTGYHALHRHGQDLFASNPTSMTSDFLAVSQWPAAWTVFADFFLVEASEIELSTIARFSVPSFLVSASTDTD